MILEQQHKRSVLESATEHLTVKLDKGEFLMIKGEYIYIYIYRKRIYIIYIYIYNIFIYIYIYIYISYEIYNM